MNSLHVKLLTAFTALTLFATVQTSGLVNAESANTDLPLDAGIVIDVSGGDNPTPVEPTNPVAEQNVVQSEPVSNEVPPVETNNVTSPEGNELPIDNGVTPPVSQEVDLTKRDEAQETNTPATDTTVLSSKEPEPVIEPLAKTGLMDSSVLVALSAILIAGGALVFNRRQEEEEEETM